MSTECVYSYCTSPRSPDETSGPAAQSWWQCARSWPAAAWPPADVSAARRWRGSAAATPTQPQPLTGLTPSWTSAPPNAPSWHRQPSAPEDPMSLDAKHRCRLRSIAID
eukprot:scaffold655265_cov45-Prasinocladus_malaysianus.AAC.2